MQSKLLLAEVVSMRDQALAWVASFVSAGGVCGYQLRGSRRISRPYSGGKRYRKDNSGMTANKGSQPTAPAAIMWRRG
jgi:hypothetical protein